MPARLGLTVYEGRALITGIVPDATERAEAVGLAWQVEGIKDVINEMQEGGGGMEAFTRDSWISTQLKSRITFDREIYAVNYTIETVNGVVYLIGIAQNQAELDRVVAHARDLAYVQRVVSHVRVKGTA
jgi:osmotically-inducible protein OsmY